MTFRKPSALEYRVQYLGIRLSAQKMYRFSGWSNVVDELEKSLRTAIWKAVLFSHLKFKYEALMNRTCAVQYCEIAQAQNYELRISRLCINIWGILLYDSFKSLSSLKHRISKISESLPNVFLCPLPKPPYTENKLYDESWLESTQLETFQRGYLTFSCLRNYYLCINIFQTLLLESSINSTCSIKEAQKCSCLFLMTAVLSFRKQSWTAYMFCVNPARRLCFKMMKTSLYGLTNCWLCINIRRPTVSQSQKSLLSQQFQNQEYASSIGAVRSFRKVADKRTNSFVFSSAPATSLKTT
jgi:hypothetical protein